MGLFSGLEAFGLKNENRKIYEEPEESKKTETIKQEKKEIPVKEEDILFPKSHVCPICDEAFKSLAVKAGKVRNIGQEIGRAHV